MVKNEEKYIQQAITSVLSHVGHIIIVDTGSTDKTIEKIEAIKLLYEVFQNEPKTKITFIKKNVSGDSINWDGNHLSAELTKIRNQMLSDTETDWVLQVDGDEIIDNRCITEIASTLELIKNDNRYKGLMLPICWCVSDTEYVVPGPFPKTLRVMPSNGQWIGEFPNEFLYVDGKPIHINDPRCITLNHGFLHMSMALHPERRPNDGQVLQLTDEEKLKLR